MQIWEESSAIGPFTEVQAQNGREEHFFANTDEMEEEETEEDKKIEECLRRCLGWTNDLLEQGKAALNDRGDVSLDLGGSQG